MASGNYTKRANVSMDKHLDISVLIKFGKKEGYLTPLADLEALSKEYKEEADRCFKLAREAQRKKARER